ncbi:MAG TPA: M56 family metallopeptidase [Gemmatimonadales bacterium]
MSPALFFALDLVVKATVIIAAAAILSTLLAKRAAAVRHLIWAAALVVIAALPFVVPAAPSIAITVPIAAAAPAPVVAGPFAAASATGGSAASLDAARSTYWQPGAVVQTVPAPHHYWWLALWLAGVTLLLARIVVGQLRIRRVIARGEDAMSLVGAGMVAALAEQQRVPHAPRVLLSDEIESPLMSGTRHPVIVLPRSAEAWSVERLRIVLVHELAHIGRFDHLAQCIGDIACAAFWIHPGVWYAASRMRRESELAADDRVIMAGHQPVSYATHLVDIARGAAAPPLAGAVAMARLTHLEERVRVMLQTNHSPGGITRRHQVVTIVAAFAVAVPLAGLRARAEAQARPGPVPARQESDSAAHQTLPVTSGGLLHIDLPTGGDIEVRGADENTIRVMARTGQRTPAVLLDRTTDGASLTVTFAPAGQLASYRVIEVLVPRRYSVSLQSGGGNVRVDGVDGNVSGHTGGGDLTVTHVNGRLALTSATGAVRVSDSHLDGYISTDDGQVAVHQVTGTLTASAASSTQNRDPMTFVARKRDAEAATASADVVVQKRDAEAAAASAGVVTRKWDAEAAAAGGDGAIAIIVGRITDDQGRPVGNARIIGAPIGGGASLQTRTDDAGAYRLIFSPAPSQTFDVVAISSGHAPARYVVKQQPDDDRIVLDMHMHAAVAAVRMDSASTASARRDSLIAQHKAINWQWSDRADAARDSQVAQHTAQYKTLTGNAYRDSLVAQHKVQYKTLAGDAYRDSTKAQWNARLPTDRPAPKVTYRDSVARSKVINERAYRDSAMVQLKYRSSDSFYIKQAQAKSDSVMAQDNFKRRADKYLAKDTVYQVDSAGRVIHQSVWVYPAKPR